MSPDIKLARRAVFSISVAGLVLPIHLLNYKPALADSEPEQPESEEPELEDEPVIWTPDPNLSLNVRSLYYHNIPSFKWFVDDVMSITSQGYRPVRQSHITRRLAGDPDSSIKDATEGKLLQVFIDDAWSIHFNAAQYLQEEYRRQTGEEIEINLAVMTKLGPTVSEAKILSEERGTNITTQGPEGPIDTLPLTRKFYPDTNNLTYGVLGDGVRVIQSGIAIVSHTINHPYLSKLTQGAMQAEIVGGLQRNEKIYQLAGTDQPVPVMVYSNGDTDNRVRKFMSELEENYRKIDPNGLIMGYGTGNGEFISLENHQEAPREHRS